MIRLAACRDVVESRRWPASNDGVPRGRFSAGDVAELRHELELRVELAPFATPAELQLSLDRSKDGATRERRLTLRSPWFGLGRPRIVRMHYFGSPQCRGC